MAAQAVLAAFAALVVLPAAFAGNGIRENLAIIRQYRLRHFLESLLAAVAVLAVAAGLEAVFPVLTVNPVLWVIAELSRSGTADGGPNLMFSGLHWKWYAAAYLPVLVLAMPRLARAEENTYRAGTRTWPAAVLRSLLFGLEHALMLISLGVCLALTLTGLWLTRHYFTGGVQRSTTYHAAFNTVLIAAIAVFLLT